MKPKPTMETNGQFKNAQSNGINKNSKGRQYPSENTNLPCDLNDDDSSEETNRAKKSDAAVQNELKDLMNKQQATNNVKTNQFANRNQLKSTTEKNTKKVIPIKLGKKVEMMKPTDDKDCNSKEMVQEMKKAVTIPKSDKTKYQTQSKKFVEQNNIEKEICTNGGNDSKQPGNKY